MKRKDIHEILHPRSIAIIGASSDYAKGATMFLSSLKAIGYEGKLYPIHPKADIALGLKTYPSLLDVPGSIDHVIVGVPAHAAPKVLKMPLKKGFDASIFLHPDLQKSERKRALCFRKKLPKLPKER